MELRTVRANQFSFDDNKLNVSGYVNETGKRSDPIPNWGETDKIPEDAEFVEVMKPGVFADAIRNADFVDFYFEHNSDKYLSSTREGSLSLTEDQTGLKMSANIVPTTWGNDAYTLIKSGAVKSMSFGFVPLQDEWDMSGDIPVRTVTQLQLLEVSAVRFPAYPDSSIEARRKHFKRLNQILERRGLTLSYIHKKRGVKNMPKKETTKKEVRSGGNMSQSMGAADVQNLASALTKNSTSIDNLTNAVQEGSEVLSNIFGRIMQSANDDRSKKDVHKKAAKSEKRSEVSESQAPASESAKPAQTASSVASSEGSVAASATSESSVATSASQSASVKPTSTSESETKTSATPASVKSARAKKASEKASAASEANKRAAKATSIMKALKDMNEDV